MKNSTINRILMSIIFLLLLAICVLIILIATRPKQVTTQSSNQAPIAEMSASEILSVENALSETEKPEDTATYANPTSESASTESKSKLYAKTTSLLNIRASNSTDAEVIETVNENTILEVLQIQQDGWTKILYEGQEAYVSSSYIILIQE